MKYTAWITITITHTYFHTGHCGIELKETDSSALLMKKAGILFRKLCPNQWVLLKPEVEEGTINVTDSILNDEVKTLDFNLIIKSNDFFYYTSWTDQSVNGANWALRKVEDTNKKYLQMLITPELVKKSKNIDITIPSREARWEFILIPKYSNTTYPIELKENLDKLIFSTPEEVSFPGEKKAYRCITESFIPMKEKYDYKISLWETREKGQLLLSNHIPYPKPDSRSISNPKEMITSYFYY